MFGRKFKTDEVIYYRENLEKEIVSLSVTVGKLQQEVKELKCEEHEWKVDFQIFRAYGWNLQTAKEYKSVICIHCGATECVKTKDFLENQAKFAKKRVKELTEKIKGLDEQAE